MQVIFIIFCWEEKSFIAIYTNLKFLVWELTPLYFRFYVFLYQKKKKKKKIKMTWIAFFSYKVYFLLISF